MYKLMAAAAALLAIASTPLAAQEATDPELERLKLLKAQLDLETQAYAASKAKSDADAAAAAAKFGPLTSVKTEGVTEVGANSGKLEATLMAAEATRQSAVIIARDMCSLLATKKGGTACGDKGEGPSRLLVFTETEKPNFDAYDAFKLQVRAIDAELSAFIPPDDQNIVAATGGPAIATALSVVGNLFRSDYKINSVDVTPSDMLLLKYFVQEARVADLKTVLVAPGLYAGLTDITTNPAIIELEKLEEKRNKVANRADELRKQAAKKPKNKDALDKQIAAMDAAIKRHDDFVKKLSTPDDAGKLPLANVARQATFTASLKDDSQLLILKSELAAGSTYAKKNFWTFLGSMPFSVSGGSLVSYTLVNAKTGQLIHAGVLPNSEPFTKIHAASQQYGGQ